jgi:undecaprenyl pyrophosphate phosphatase UppP
MDRVTWKMAREFFFFVAMPALLLNAYPVTRDFFSRVFEFEIVAGVNLITIIALITALLAIKMYNREL